MKRHIQIYCFALLVILFAGCVWNSQSSISPGDVVRVYTKGGAAPFDLVVESYGQSSLFGRPYYTDATGGSGFASTNMHVEIKTKDISRIKKLDISF